MATGIPAERLEEIFSGRRPIDADAAEKFGKLFNTDAQFFRNLQLNYDTREPLSRQTWQRDPAASPSVLPPSPPHRKHHGELVAA